MDEVNYKDIWLSLAIVLPIAAVGLFLLRNDPTAKGFLGFGTIIVGTIVRHHIYERELRRKGVAPPIRHRR